jgi:hypothetical protein
MEDQPLSWRSNFRRLVFGNSALGDGGTPRNSVSKMPKLECAGFRRRSLPVSILPLSSRR